MIDKHAQWACNFVETVNELYSFVVARMCGSVLV